MPFQIQVPGKGIAEFPDEVSYDDAFKSIQEDVPDWQPSRADVFAQLKSQSDAFAAPDRARYAGQLGVTDKPSGFDYLASSAANYAGQMGSSVPGALGVLGGVQEGLGLGNSINERVRKPVQNFIDDTFTVDPETTTGLKGLLTTGVAGGAGQLHGQLLLSKAFKVSPQAANAISSLAGGAQEFTDAWDRERERQNQAGEDDPLKALIKSGGYAAIATILESRLGPGHLAEKMAELGKGKVNNIIASAFKNAASGGAEEFLQRIAQDLIVDGKPDWKAAAGEGLVGAIVQGGAGTSIDAFNNHAVAQKDKQKAVFEEKYSNFLAQEAKRSNLDSAREQSANELAQMVGFEKPHSDQDIQTRNALVQANATLTKPQVAAAPVATPAAQPQIQSEIQLLNQAENARQSGQISDQEYMVAVDRFEKARAAERVQQSAAQPPPVSLGQPVSASVESTQPPPLPAPQTPNPLGGESTNEGQIQEEKGLLTQPVTPPLSQSAEGVVQPQPTSTQPTATPAVALESNPPDKIDAALSRAIEATNPFGKSNTIGLDIPVWAVLKMTRYAYRAGKSLTNAIKESIAQYRASNPTAQFNDAEVDARVRIKLQDFLSGGEDALAIAKAAEPAVAENERAAAMIHSEEYTRQRITDRRKELNRFHDQSVQQALGNGIDVALVPKVTSSDFPEFAASLGMDAGLIQQLQGDVARESKARRLSELQTQSEEINGVINKLLQHSPSKNAPLIEQLTEDKAKLDKRIARKGFDDARVRASEILDHTREYVSRKARLEALNNPDVKEAISGPVQVLRDLMAEYPDLRDRGVSAWVSDPNITDDVKRVVVARLSTAFREFDARHDNVATTLAASEDALERQINRLKERISKGEIRKAYIDIVIEEARLAAAGETGLTGGLGVNHLEWFDANAEALRSFARSLAEKLNGTGQDALDARKLSDWLLFSPDDAPPAVKNTAQSNWGVGDETLSRILKALQESPAVRNAVAAIYEKGSEKLPAHELRRIATIALSGEEGDSEFAAYLAKQLQKKKGAELLKVTQRLRTDAKNLLDARIRLETLREALKLFKGVEASPVFKDARIETETQEGSFTRQMFVVSEKALTLRGFEGPEISQPEINTGAAIGGGTEVTSQTKNAIESWRRSARQYITAYDAALQESKIIPNAPHPISLGFDEAVYRGLQNALEESNILMDPSTYDDGSKIDSFAGLASQGQSMNMFRQIDLVARMVEGVYGKNFQLKSKRYRDAKLDVGTVFHNRQNASMPALLSKAMASHPKMGGFAWLKKIPKFGTWFNENFAPGGNVDVYRTRVFNPLAHAARGNFVESPKVGDVLHTGEIVTQADLDLLDQSIKYSSGLLKVAQYKRGTLMNIGKREYRRAAASVGVKGTSRHITEYGKNAFMVKLISEFGNDDDDGVFTSGDDLANGTRSWIKFWNQLAISDDVLTVHVLDSARRDRAITVSPYMKTAYEGLAASLKVNNYENRISNLEDLVNKLQVHFPTNTGVDSRAYILAELGKEFGQYVAHSKAKVEGMNEAQLDPNADFDRKKKDTRQRSSSIIETETMNNEFTKPAADLVIPSVYYDYGSITQTEMALAKDRAVGEATVEMKHAMRDAETNIRSYMTGIDEEGDEHKRLKYIADQIHNLDIDIGVDMRKRSIVDAGFRQAGGLAMSAVLTSPPAQIGNVTSSALPAYIYASRVGRVHKLAMLAMVVTHTAKATKNLAYVFIHKAVGGAASGAFKQLSKSKNPAMVNVANSITDMMDKAMRWVGFASADDAANKAMNWSGFSNAAEVQSIGLSQTDRLLTAIANDIRTSLQFVDDAEQSKYTGVIGKSRLAGRALKTAALSSFVNFNKTVGLESGDLAVNMTANQAAKNTERDLKDMAVRWANERVQKLGGEFDESKKEWQARPDEWLGGWFSSAVNQEKSMAGLRVQLSESGEQLENAMWDYFKRSEGGKLKDVEFFKDPASFRRTVVGAFNANVFTNRPQRAQTNPEQGMFQTLLNYTSWLATAVNGAFKTVKTVKGMKKWLGILMTAIWGAIASVMVGLMTSAGREVVGRAFLGRIDRMMTSMDKEFWNLDADLPKRIAMAALAVQPMGQTLVNLSELNRPDFASGNFYVGLINSIAAYSQGAARVQRQDLGWLFNRLFKQFIFPFSSVLERGFGDSAARDINSGVAAAASATKASGLGKPGAFANAAGMQFTEKTPILAKINEAGMRAQLAKESGDSEALSAAKADLEREKDRLIKFHKDALIEDNKRRGVTMPDFKVDQEAIASARKDWMSLNPLAKALGHQPTENEMERINANLSGDRKAAFDRAWNSYSGMAEYFPDGKGVATEPNQTRKEKLGGIARSSGGGLGISSASGLSASLRGGSLSGGIRASGGSRSRSRGSVRLSRMSRGLSRLRRGRSGVRRTRRVRF